jgi:hypothetical protein
MPEVAGGAEKMDKRARGHHASHKFLGIHDKEFRKKGVDINISTGDKSIEVTLKNKMEHPLIIQPARAKYLKIMIKRVGKVIWKNYQQEPNEDKQGYFAYRFKKSGEKIVIPATATSGEVHNLEAKETKVLKYETLPLQKGDKIIVQLYVRFGKGDCAKEVELQDTAITTPELIKEIVFIQD